MPKATKRCTGHCCENFRLPFAPDELWAAYYRWQHGGNAESLRMNNGQPMPNPQDIQLIAPMVVYLGPATALPMKHINPSDEELLGQDWDPPNHYYRCKHFDSKERLCTIYEHRPVMCREYPYGDPCNYTSCTWVENKAKKQTKKERAERLRVLQEAEEKGTDPGGERESKPVDINETINVVALVNELNDKRRAELITQLQSMKPKAKKGRGARA